MHLLSCPRPGFLLVLASVALAFAGCSSTGSSRSPSDIALAEENYKLKAEREKLRQQLEVATSNRTTANPAAPLPAQLDQAEEKLSHALRSYSQAQDESTQLKTEIEKARSENSALTSQVQELTARASTPSAASAPATNAAPAPSSPTPDAESNLATALRTYSLVREENEGLKSERDRLSGEKAALEVQVSALKTAVPVAAQAESLRDQLRQVRAQSAAFAEENARLKTALALGGAAPGAGAHGITPVAIESTPDPVPAPPAEVGPRMHTVVAGDTLSRIAQKYYGTASRWPEILAANRDKLANENSLAAGQTIRIP